MILSMGPGDVAQLEERDNRTVEVRGSSPLISTYQYVSHIPQKCLANRKRLWYSGDTVGDKSGEQE